MLTFSTFSSMAMALWASSLDPHVHGEGQLVVSADGSMLIVEFTADQHTVFGFEGQAKTETQVTQKGRVSQRITSPGILFSIATSVPCELASTDVEEYRSADGLGGHEHELDDHDDHHHDDHSHHDHDEHDVHQDVVVRSVLTCDAPPTIETVEVTAFEELSGLESVRVTVLTDDQQLEQMATRSKRLVRFP